MAANARVASGVTDTHKNPPARQPPGLVVLINSCLVSLSSVHDPPLDGAQTRDALMEAAPNGAFVQHRNLVP